MLKAVRAWLVRLAGTWPSARRERELQAEIESHLQLHVDDNLRAGMSPAAARRDALLKLGGVDPTKEAYRDRAGFPLLEQCLQDARFAIRQLGRSPGFAVTAVVVIALAVGASAAIFAFVDAALIQTLPYRDPSRLVSVTESLDRRAGRTPLSHADYLDWKAQNSVLDSLEVFTGTGHLLDTPDGAELVSGARVSAGFFRTLGVVPVLGRDFVPGEDLAGAPATLILGYSAWQGRFGARPDVLGRTAVLSGVPHTIVGVLPREFQFAPRGRAEMWTPLQPTDECGTRRSCHNLVGVGRLKEGRTIAAADADMKRIAAVLEKQYPDSNRGQGASVIALSDSIVGGVRPILLVLLGGAGLLVLIATVNVASLLLVRSEGRRHEIALRGALGASRGRLLRQFTTEGLVLAAAGSSLGVVLAAGAMRLLVRLIPDDMLIGLPFLRDLGLNAHVLAFVAGISLAAAALFSLTPALRVPLAEGRAGLAEGGRGGTGLAWRRFASHLVALEMAVAVVLLVGAGLLGRSFQRLLDVDLGFAPDHLVTLRVAAPPAREAKPEQSVALAREIVRRVESLPGVEGAAVTSLLPVTYNGNTDWIRFVGRPYNGEHNEVNQRDVGAGYLGTLRARLRRGRFFTDSEDASKPLVVVINETLARTYFRDQDPIGQRFGDTSLSPGSIKEIIGVVEDIHEGGLDSETWPTVYYPFNQATDSWFSLVARTSQEGRGALVAIRAEIRAIDPGLGMTDETTMAERIANSTSAYLHRSSAWLIGGFAGLALVLSVIGLYGVVAYSVSRRSREIGLRMALGAARSSVYRMILEEAARLAVAGVALGLVASAGLATLMEPLLFQTSAWDLPTLAAVASTLGVCALLASFVPARRAASVDPVIALRAE